MFEIVLLVISIVCWWLVLDKRARKQQSEPAKYLFRLSKDRQDMLEGSGFAAALIGGIFSTIFLLFLLLMRILS